VVIAWKWLFGIANGSQSNEAHFTWFIRLAVRHAWRRLLLSRLLAWVLYCIHGVENIHYRVEIVTIIYGIGKRNFGSSLLSKALEIYPSVGKYVLVNHKDLSPQLLSGRT
jgi:hypothetical protein